MAIQKTMATSIKLLICFNVIKSDTLTQWNCNIHERRGKIGRLIFPAFSHNIVLARERVNGYKLTLALNKLQQVFFKAMGAKQLNSKPEYNFLFESQ